MRFFSRAGIALFAFLAPTLAYAHEVYVLSPATVARDIALHSPNPFLAYKGNEIEFFFWGFVVFVGFSTVFFVSIYHRLERFFAEPLRALKPWAHLIVRITFGVCLIACAYYGALFGPELPLAHLFGAYAALVRAVLLVSGVLVLLGLFARLAALAVGVILAGAMLHVGSYILTYANYLGEIVFLLIMGPGTWSLGAHAGRGRLSEIASGYERYAFAVLRVLLGVSIMFASVFAKFVHSRLALDTVTQYHLTNYFPFDPLFIVLGALIIEFMIGFLIAAGIEIRWTAIFFLFWLILSLLYFREAVWPHLVFAGLLLAIFCAGYDRYSIEGYLFKRSGREPVL